MALGRLEVPAQAAFLLKLVDLLCSIVQSFNPVLTCAVPRASPPVFRPGGARPPLARTPRRTSVMEQSSPWP